MKFFNKIMIDIRKGKVLDQMKMYHKYMHEKFLRSKKPKQPEPIQASAPNESTTLNLSLSTIAPYNLI